MVLRYGELIMLTARDLNGNYKSDILCYARYSLMETCVIATSIATRIAYASARNRFDFLNAFRLIQDEQLDFSAIWGGRKRHVYAYYSNWRFILTFQSF